MEMLDIMKARHSVRQYKNKPIEAAKRAELDALIAQINAGAGTHIQIFYDEPQCFDSFMAHYGKFTGVCNYIALVGKKGAGLDETLGYYGEELVLRAQQLGLNTCWVALSHGKSRAEIRKGERLVCLISLGYGETQGSAHTNKPLSQLCSPSDHLPAWFSAGMEAALLAPTAMNQQKFCFTLLPDGSVQASCTRGFYTRLDLGIAQYHFEAVSGKKVALK